MPVIGYSLKIDSRRVLERLNLVRNVIEKPPRSVYEAVRDVMAKRVMERFKTKTDPNGQRWKKWASSTRAMRQMESKSATDYKPDPVSLLEYTGAMKKSFFAKTRGGIVQLGFKVPYAGYHETGTMDGAGKQKMPARPVLTSGAYTGEMALSKPDRISAGLAVRKAALAALDRYLNT